MPIVPAHTGEAHGEPPSPFNPHIRVYYRFSPRPSWMPNINDGFVTVCGVRSIAAAMIEANTEIRRRMQNKPAGTEYAVDRVDFITEPAAGSYRWRAAMKAQQRRAWLNIQ